MTKRSWPCAIPLPAVSLSPTAAGEPSLSRLSSAPMPHWGEGGQYASTDEEGSCELGCPSALTPAPRQVHTVDDTTSPCVCEGGRGRREGGRGGREGEEGGREGEREGMERGRGRREEREQDRDR